MTEPHLALYGANAPKVKVNVGKGTYEENRNIDSASRWVILVFHFMQCRECQIRKFIANA